MTMRVEDGLSAVFASVLHCAILVLPLVVGGRSWRIFVDVPIVVFLLSAVSHGLIEGLASFRCGDGSLIRVDRGAWDTMLGLATGISLLAVSWVSLVTHDIRSDPAASGLSLLGLIAMMAGVALRCLSMLTLGSGFVSASRLQPGQPVLSVGIYRYLRHPSEAGLLCIAFGTPMLLESLVGFAIAGAVLLPLSLYRICIEDAALRAAAEAGYRERGVGEARGT